MYDLLVDTRFLRDKWGNKSEKLGTEEIPGSMLNYKSKLHITFFLALMIYDSFENRFATLVI